MLSKSPGFTLIVILTLTLGLGLNVALFTLLDDEFLRPKQVVHPEELWAVVPADATGKPRFFNFSEPYYQAIIKNNHVFKDATCVFRVNAKHRTADGSDDLFGNVVGANYLDFIGTRPLLGRGFLPEEENTGATPVVIISYEFWQEQFGGQLSALGKILDLDGHDFEIVGVTGPDFVGLGSANAKFIIPWGTVHLFYPSPPYDPIVRLKDGVSPRAAADSLAPIVREVTATLHPPGLHRLRAAIESSNNADFSRVALLRAGYGTADRHFAYEDRANLIRVNSLAGFGTLLVLLIAGGNLANLLLARGLHRRRELATRIAIGATRGALVRQLALEGLLLTALGACGALVLVTWLGRIAPTLMSAVMYNPWIPVNSHPDSRILVFGVIISLLVGICFSLPPAFAATSFRPFDALRDSGLGVSGQRWSPKAVLVVMQVAGSLVLLSSVFLCLRAINAQLNSSIGFNPEPLTMVSVNLEKVGFNTNTALPMCQVLLTRFSGLPGVQKVGMIDDPPFSGERGSLATDRVRLHEGTEVEHATVNVGPGYFKAMGIPLSAGREVSESDFASGREVALVNETFVRSFWRGHSVLGWRIERVRRQAFEVIGIVSDARLDSPMKAPRPTVYYLANRYDALHPTFILRASRADGLLPAIRSELVNIHPLLGKSTVVTMREALKRPFSPQRNVMKLLVEVALVALILTMLGAYGLVSFLVTRRTSEFGIRLAIGAGRSDILKLVLKLGLGLALTGTIVGLPLAFGGSFFLRYLVSGVSPLDIVSFSLGVMVVLLAILLACYFPAQRASKVDPLTALRHE